MRATCTVPNCARSVHGLGYCSGHYQRHVKGRPVEGQLRPRQGPAECLADDCGKKPVGQGVCAKHYYRMQVHGSLDLPQQPGPATRYMSHNGYVMVYMPDHPMANTAKVVFEHRLVMAEHLGRSLTRDENVHHVNGIKTDNRIENLELWTRCQPSGQRVADKVSWAVQLLQKYAPEHLQAVAETVPASSDPTTTEMDVV